MFFKFNQVAYEIIEKGGDLNILKVVEEKMKNRITNN